MLLGFTLIPASFASQGEGEEFRKKEMRYQREMRLLRSDRIEVLSGIGDPRWGHHILHGGGAPFRHRRAGIWSWMQSPPAQVSP